MLGFQEKAHYRQAAETLAQIDYTERGIGELLGRHRILAVGALDLPPWLARTRGLSPLDTLIRLFLLGVDVPASAAKRALAPVPLDAWVDAGLVLTEDEQGQVSSAVRLLPVEGLIIAADRPQRRLSSASADYVMSPAVTTMEVADAMIRNSCRRTLDLGTGSGTLGLLAAAHSDEVLLTDSNPRAVAFADFNAHLNCLNNVAAREGSLFEPIATDRFDLIISNPPFVISPSKRFLFRDAETRGDQFCRQLIRTASAFLNEGGYCQLQCNCAHEVGDDWRDSLTRWFEGLRCDVVVWVLRTEDISDYAMTWIIGTEARDVDEVPQVYQRWTEYYESQGIEAVSYLLVTLRRTDRHYSWTRIDDTPRRIVGPCAHEVLTAFALQDSCGSSMSDTDLLDKRLQLTADIHIQQSHAMTSAGLRVVETQLHKTKGTQFVMRIEPQIGGFTARCDGRRSVHEILGEMTATLGEEERLPDTTVARAIRTLIDRGILVPVELLAVAK